MRYFIDCEFLEIGPKYPVYLASIGISCEDGRTYYAENEDCPLHLANDWVKENVIPQLHRSKAKPRHVIAAEILAFVGATRSSGPPRFYGYYSAYDWVLFAQLFGTLMDMPSSWPKFCIDLKQIWLMLGGKIQLPKPTGSEHHANDDSGWNRVVFDVLNDEWKEAFGSDLP